jgi:hypothetical protein
MALVKRTYVNGTTIITAENLNAIQDEIIANAGNMVTAITYDSATNSLKSTKNGTSSTVKAFGNMVDFSVTEVTS